MEWESRRRNTGWGQIERGRGQLNGIIDAGTGERN